MHRPSPPAPPLPPSSRTRVHVAFAPSPSVPSTRHVRRPRTSAEPAASVGGGAASAACSSHPARTRSAGATPVTSRCFSPASRGSTAPPPPTAARTRQLALAASPDGARASAAGGGGSGGVGAGRALIAHEAAEQRAARDVVRVGGGRRAARKRASEAWRPSASDHARRIRRRVLEDQ